MRMRVGRIEQHEVSFSTGKRDSNGRRHVLLKKAIEIPGDDAEMRYVDVKPADGNEGYFYRVKHAKEQVVLHFTMGYLKGDLATLTKPDRHVSVPFLVARDGTIYNLFPSFYWSYHLGPGAKAGNTARSRATIGIEISNIGPLMSNGDQLTTTYSTPERRDVYCDLDQDGFYVEAPFRGFDYYATFTDAQYVSVIQLLRYVTARYGIRRRFLPPARRYGATVDNARFLGIISHVNYRPTGKTDIGPAFDWTRVMEQMRE